jgi:hypothetical protein
MGGVPHTRRGGMGRAALGQKSGGREMACVELRWRLGRTVLIRARGEEQISLILSSKRNLISLFLRLQNPS